MRKTTQDLASQYGDAERADSPVVWPVRLRHAFGLPGLAGGGVTAGVLLAVWLAEWGDASAAVGVAAGVVGVVGEGLFFAVSLGLIVELAATIPLAAQRDIDALADELTVDDALRGRLRAALVRFPGRDMALNAAIGAAIGVVHVVLTARGTSGLPSDAVAVVLALGTVALWAMMVQTGALLMANASLFARLGRSAVRVEIHAPDRLRPFATAALRPMLLIMALLALRARVQDAPSLPIGMGGLGRGLVYLALPVATWGGKGFTEALLGWFL